MKTGILECITQMRPSAACTTVNRTMGFVALCFIVASLPLPVFQGYK